MDSVRRSRAEEIAFAFPANHRFVRIKGIRAFSSSSVKSGERTNATDEFTLCLPLWRTSSIQNCQTIVDNLPIHFIAIHIAWGGSRIAAANGPLRDAWNIGVVCGIYLCASVSLWFADFRLKTEPPGAFGPRRFITLASTYSPTQLPVQYHRRVRA